MRTQERLNGVTRLLDESLGVRANDSRPKLSPVPHRRDIGRRPLRGYGRLDIDQLIPAPGQPRTEFDDESLATLAANLRAKGQLHPIHVCWSEESQRWMIVSGERRWRAARLAGLDTVDCFFHENALGSSEMLELQLIENLLREDLRPVEQAKGFQALMDLNRWNGKQVAEALRIAPSTVSRALALLDLPVDVQQQVDAGDVPARTAYQLSRLTDGHQQRQLAVESARGALTNTAAAQAVRQRTTRQASKPKNIRQTFFAENGCQTVVIAPRMSSYYDLEAALVEALEEVRLRIVNNVRL
jgi:ParB family transcriptional regulator, chromosome partitioning protein